MASSVATVAKPFVCVCVCVCVRVCVLCGLATVKVLQRSACRQAMQTQHQVQRKQHRVQRSSATARVDSLKKLLILSEGVSNPSRSGRSKRNKHAECKVDSFWLFSLFIIIIIIINQTKM